MDEGFTEALAAFWDKRADTLAPDMKAHDAALEKALKRFNNTLTNEQIDIYLDAEDEMSRREATVKEFFYKTGFRDAVRFLLHCYGNSPL